MKTLVPPGRRTLRSWKSMFDWITGLLSVLGLFGGFLLTLAENVFPPIPSEVVLPLPGYVGLAGQWLSSPYRHRRRRRF